MTYLIDILKEDDKDFPNPKYAYNGTVNWMRALRICGADINDMSLNDFYSKIQPSNKFSKISLVSLFSSMNYLQSIHTFNLSQNTPYLNGNLAIIGWYYSILNAAQAMICAFNNSRPDTHTSASNSFFELSKNAKVLSPFNYSLENLKEDSIKSQILTYSGNQELGNPLSSSYFPRNNSSSQKCLLAYLKGTADYSNWKTEEHLKRGPNFRDRRLVNFKTKEARALRDKEFEKKKVSFMHQAFRFRGKANYRDCMYFYDNQGDIRLNNFFYDLEFVAHKFLLMASIYVSKRAGSTIWEQFIETLNNKDREVLNENYLNGLQ